MILLSKYNKLLYEAIDIDGDGITNDKIEAFIRSYKREDETTENYLYTILKSMGQLDNMSKFTEYINKNLNIELDKLKEKGIIKEYEFEKYKSQLSLNYYGENIPLRESASEDAGGEKKNFRRKMKKSRRKKNKKKSRRKKNKKKSRRKMKKSRRKMKKSRRKMKKSRRKII